MSSLPPFPARTTKTCSSPEEASATSVAINRKSLELCFVLFNCCFNRHFLLTDISDWGVCCSLQDLCCIPPCDPAAALFGTPWLLQAMPHALLSAEASWCSWTGGYRRHQGTSTAAMQHTAVSLGCMICSRARVLTTHLLSTAAQKHDLCISSSEACSVLARGKQEWTKAE